MEMLRCCLKWSACSLVSLHHLLRQYWGNYCVGLGREVAIQEVSMEVSRRGWEEGGLSSTGALGPSVAASDSWPGTQGREAGFKVSLTLWELQGGPQLWVQMGVVPDYTPNMRWVGNNETDNQWDSLYLAEAWVTCLWEAGEHILTERTRDAGRIPLVHLGWPKTTSSYPEEWYNPLRTEA